MRVLCGYLARVMTGRTATSDYRKGGVLVCYGQVQLHPVDYEGLAVWVARESVQPLDDEAREVIAALDAEVILRGVGSGA